MQIEAIRDVLRNGAGPSLRPRRRIGILAALGAVDFTLISLYQMGIIRHLPHPPDRIFDSDHVNASRRAYALGVPDRTLILAATETAVRDRYSRAAQAREASLCCPKRYDRALLDGSCC